jgi:hypothetical protein
MPIAAAPPEIRTLFVIYQDVAKRPSPARQVGVDRRSSRARHADRVGVTGLRPGACTEGLFVERERN